MKHAGLALILATALLAGCSTSAPLLTSTQTLDTHKSFSNQQMQTAIYQSLQRYGWQMDSDDGSSIVAHYNKQERHVAVIRIDYSANSFSIRHQLSRGLNYNAQRNTIHRNYNRWILNLEQDIRSRTSFM